MRFEALKAELEDATKAYDDAVWGAFRNLMYSSSDGQKYRDDVRAAFSQMDDIEKRLAINPFGSLAKLQGVKTPKDYITKLHSALYPDNSAARATGLREAHEQLRSMGKTPFHAELDGLSTELEAAAQGVRALAQAINKDQGNLKSRLPSPVLGTDTGNVFTKIGFVLTPLDEKLIELGVKEKALAEARTNLESEIDKLNDPSVGGASPGKVVRIVRADYGNLEVAADELARSPPKERRFTCDATGQFQVLCELTIAERLICLTRGKDLSNCEAENKKPQKVIVDNPSPYCAVVVNDSLCGTRNPAWQAKRSVRVIYRCGSSPEKEKVIRDGESVFLDCR